MRGRAAVRTERGVIDAGGDERGADQQHADPVVFHFGAQAVKKAVQRVLARRVAGARDQRRPRVLEASVAHQRTDRQEGRAVHAVKESRVDKVAQGLKETQESQGQAPRGTIGSQKGPRHMNLDWALRSPREATVSRVSG